MSDRERGQSRVVLEILRLLVLAPLLLWRLHRAGGRSTLPPSHSMMVSSSPSSRESGSGEVEPQGWLLAHDELRVLYGCSPEGEWLRFRYYGDDLDLLYHTNAARALEAINAGFWTVFGTEEEALAAGRELAMEQFEYLLLELLA